jgi:iron(III) transport system substrate-binding protein
VSGVAVAAHAPHPSAALLWYEFEISEDGQRLLPTRDFVPTNSGIETPLNRFPMRFVDAGRARRFRKMAAPLR